jgi:signal transduction histidine kinase
MTANADREQPLPTDTEARLTDFTELLATAIANAQSRGELAASRARIVAAADETRRRIERNLHDGAQQRLVSLGLELRAAQAAVPPELSELGLELSRVADGLSSTQEELREIARGIHPAMLAEGGLGPALKTVARRSRVPVELDVRADRRLPHAVEVAAYYVVSETLANADKHACASVVRVEAEAAGGILRLDVSDDGVGGADSSRGSGLAGLKDRVEAVGGTLTVRSAVDAGTSVSVELPLREVIDAVAERSPQAAGASLDGGGHSNTSR